MTREYLPQGIRQIVVDRIIVEDERIMIKGRTDVLQDLISKFPAGGTGVPTAIPDW
ncbi:hypothetical protein [Aurantimonas sp. VKM B-3413]|uniref:hypothetical protein n=1 Tax=Aurantimonas sp. VKM B-3413 TaxID=2779401 RepID=UPI001E59DD82|nr:hypothetical protein [Aurantimonas sp. VKM B-3413]MCB8836808.1 hypothetical protein [Aurantimonas sp. VKM B-3413]